mgnify:CR=1 FL=1
MTLEKIARETLRYLFSQYQKGPSAVYSIRSVTGKYGVDPVELTEYLQILGFIRERWTYADGSVVCKITIRGIEEIEPAYVREKLRQLIGGLGEAGGARELTEILEHNLQEYSISLDLVRQLEALGFIRILHPNNMIVIELTEQGKNFYDNGNKTFFTLMTY